MCLYTSTGMCGHETLEYLYQAPFGPLGIRIRDKHLAGIQFCPDHSVAPSVPDTPTTRDITAYLDAYFSSLISPSLPPLWIEGSDFQRRVWHAMQAIPFGETRTYGQLAKALHTGSRAVAQACRSNRLPIIIPCHRVVAANGPGGFMGSANRVDIKSWLLRHEGVHVS